MVDRTGRYSNYRTQKKPGLLDLMIRCMWELDRLAELLRDQDEQSAK